MELHREGEREQGSEVGSEVGFIKVEHGDATRRHYVVPQKRKLWGIGSLVDSFNATGPTNLEGEVVAYTIFNSKLG